MTYRYSYKEQWQPKNLPVIFRMYQLNLNGNNDFVYKKYWDMSDNHFIEYLYSKQNPFAEMSTSYSQKIFNNTPMKIKLNADRTKRRLNNFLFVCFIFIHLNP